MADFAVGIPDTELEAKAADFAVGIHFASTESQFAITKTWVFGKVSLPKINKKVRCYKETMNTLSWQMMNPGIRILENLYLPVGACQLLLFW